MGIGGIARQNQINAPQTNATQEVNQAPAALQGARHSVGRIAARVVAGLLTAGLSEGIRAVVVSIKDAFDNYDQVARVEADRLAQAKVDACNHQLASTIQSGKELPSAMKAAIHEGLEEVHNAFGNGDLNPAGEMSPNCLKHLQSTIRLSHDAITPERLKALVIEHARPEATTNILHSKLQQFITHENLNSVSPQDMAMLKNPDLAGLQSRIADCQNADDAHALYEEFKAPLENTIKFQDAAYSSWNEVRAEALDTIAEHTGLSPETTKSSPALQSLTHEVRAVFNDMATKNEFPNADQIKTTFKDLMTAQLGAKDALIESIQDLPISPALKEEFKIEVFCNSKFRSTPDLFTKAAEAIKDIDTNSLIAASQMPKGTMRPSELADLFKSLGANLDAHLSTAYGDGMEKLSKEELYTAKAVVAKMLFDQHPALAEAFHAAPNVISHMSQEQRVNFHMNNVMGQSTISPAILPAYEFVSVLARVEPTLHHDNTTLLNELNSPKATQSSIALQQRDACTTALKDIRANFGEASIPAGNTIAELNVSPAGKTIVNALTTAIKAADHPLTPQEVHQTLHGILQSTAQKDITVASMKTLAQEAGHTLTSFAASNVFNLLSARHPDLKETLNNATSAASIHEALQALPDAKQAIQFSIDISATKNHVFEALTNALATALNVTPEDLKKDFDADSAIGGDIYFTNKAIQDNVAKPNTEIPNAAQILERYSDRIQSVVTEKVSLLNTLPNLRGAEDRPLSAEVQADLRHRLLTFTSVSSPEMLQHFASITARLDPTACAAAINTGDQEAATAALKDFGTSIISTAHEVIPEATYAQLDAEQVDSIGAFVRPMLFDTNPTLREAFTSNKELLADIRDNLEHESSQISRKISRTNGQGEVHDALMQDTFVILQSLTLINEILEK